MRTHKQMGLEYIFANHDFNNKCLIITHMKLKFSIEINK